MYAIRSYYGVNMGSLGELWCGAKTCKLPNTNIDVYFIDYENYRNNFV